MENSMSTVVKNVLTRMPIVPSLRHLAVVKVAGAILDQEDARQTFLEKYRKFWDIDDPLEFKRLEWETLKSKLAPKVSRTCLPKTVMEDILNLAWPMVLQIYYWIEYYSRDHKLRIDLPSRICWTWPEMLDKMRTAQLIVNNENLCIKIRYRLACLHCLEDDIRELWQKLDMDDKVVFLKKSKELKRRESEFVYFWSNRVLNVVNYSITCEDMLREAVMGSNVAATKYFLQQIPFERKQEILLRSIEDQKIEAWPGLRFRFNLKDHAEVWWILISEMEMEHVMSIFTKSPAGVLCRLLSNDRELFFMEMAKHMFSFLDGNAFASVLSKILHKYQEGYNSVQYKELFVEFWDLSPVECKMHVNKDSSFGAQFLVEIIQYTFPFVSEMRTYEQKARHFCQLLKVKKSRSPFAAGQDKWEFLKILIQRRISTKQSLVFYKMTFRSQIQKKKERKQQVDLISRILNDDAQTETLQH